MQEATVRADLVGALPAAGGWEPLDSFPAAAELLTSRRLAQITWALIGLGIVVRLIRYLLQFPLWPDEAYLAHNYLDRGYLDLLKPLDYIQIAPLLYLWVQHTIIKLFGFSEYSLRLYVLLCGIGSLFLFRHLAGRLLRGTAFLLAVGTFAMAYPLIRHSAEAKPYGSDLFVSLVLLTLAVEWCRRRQESRWWWALTLVVPIACLLSYPAVFVASGISATMAIVLWRQRLWRQWLRWGLFNVALLAGFVTLFMLSARNQMNASGPAQRAAFSDDFPPLDAVGKFLAFLAVRTNELMCYPVGGELGPNLLTSLCCLTALVLLLRRRRIALAALCVVPLALHFLAATVHAYPYGGSWRLSVYMAPIFCLLMGLGAAAILSKLNSRRSALTPVVVALILLVAVGVGASVRDFLKPYKEPCWMRNRDFARWFWCEKAQDAELVCLRTDLHKCFYSPPQGDDLASVYYCNQRIYSARHARGEAADLGRVSSSRPLRYVRFRPARTTEREEDAFRQWLKTRQSQYQLVGEEKYPLSFWVKQDLVCLDRVEIYEFVPKESLAVLGAADSTSARAAQP